MYHRIDLRFPFELPVTILNYTDRSSHQIINGWIRNISFTGMFVDSISAPISDRSYIYARITKHMIGEVKLSGFVVRQVNEGIGILFDDYTSDISQGLGRLLNQSLEDYRKHLAILAIRTYDRLLRH